MIVVNNIIINRDIPKGVPVVYYAYKPGQNKNNPVGSVLVVEYPDYTEVLHIFVDKKYRRQGVGKSLVEGLQRLYKYIITGWVDSTNEGSALFLKMGFEVKAPVAKRFKKTLEWTRE